MSEMFDDPMMPSEGPDPFYKIWMDALTKPNEGTYSSLAASAEANSNKALLWVFIAALINSLFAALVMGPLTRNMMRTFGEDLGSSGIGTGLLGAICGAPLAAAVFLLMFVISVAIMQWIAGMFGGRGNFSQLAYVLGAITAPYMLVSSLFTLLSAIPFIGFCFTAIAGLGGLYILVLEIMAVKAVNQFDWGPAIGSVLLPGLVVGFLCCCLILVPISALMALGPSIGDVFSTINESLGGY